MVLLVQLRLKAQRFLLLPLLCTMDPIAQRQKGQDKVVSSLSTAIETLNLAREISGITPAKAVFTSVSVLLTMIKVASFLRR